MYSEECAMCTKASTCKLKNNPPDMCSEDGCPILMAEDLQAQGENVSIVTYSDD